MSEIGKKIFKEAVAAGIQPTCFTCHKLLKSPDDADMALRHIASDGSAAFHFTCYHPSSDHGRGWMINL